MYHDKKLVQILNIFMPNKYHYVNVYMNIYATKLKGQFNYLVFMKLFLVFICQKYILEDDDEIKLFL